MKHQLMRTDSSKDSKKASLTQSRNVQEDEEIHDWPCLERKTTQNLMDSISHVFEYILFVTVQAA